MSDGKVLARADAAIATLVLLVLVATKRSHVQKKNTSTKFATEGSRRHLRPRGIVPRAREARWLINMNSSEQSRLKPNHEMRLSAATSVAQPESERDTRSDKPFVQLPGSWHFLRCCHSNFFFKPLFSVRSSWILSCIASDRCSDGRNAVRPRRDCDVGQMA